MRFYLLLPIIVFLSVYHFPDPVKKNAVRLVNVDTTVINHSTDGFLSEWPAAKFENDVSTNISYAIDNDDENLYLALSIPNEGIQTKLEKMGMKLFIDLKGKKKEGRGISFPVKDETAVAGATDYNKAAGITSSDGQRPDEPRKPVDKKAVRSMTAIRLNYMNVFGFEGMDAHDQGLKMPGSINIAFTWDTADVMHVEYVIPLKMLGTSADLNQKDISIGWRVNGLYPSDQYSPGPERKKARNKASAAYGANSTGFDPSRKIVTRETIIRENNFWTHYIVNVGK